MGRSKSKWRKWQLSVGGAAALAVLFQAVKSDPAFSAAHERKLAETGAGGDAVQAPAKQEQRDPVFEQFDRERQNGAGRSGRRHGPGNGRVAPDAPAFGQSQQTDGPGQGQTDRPNAATPQPHTRTRHS
jgi:hypothetical protein